MSFPNLRIGAKGDRQRVVKTPPGSLEKVLFHPAEKLKRLFHLAPASRPRPCSARADLKSSTLPLSKSPFRTVSTSPTALADKLRIYSPSQDRPSIDPSKPVVFDRERLSEDLIEVKISNNALRAENVRLKTQITVLEKEVCRKSTVTEETPPNLHVVSMLKQSVKDLKEIVRIKDEESALIRREMKATKIAEMEVELKSYQEECKRLANALKNKALDSDSRKDTASEDVRQENTALRNDLDRLAKELKDEKDAAKKRKKAENHKNTEIEGLKTTIDQLQKEKDATEKEKQKLKAVNEQCNSDISAFKEKLQSYEQQIRTLTEDRSRLRSQLDHYTDGNEAFKQEKVRLKESIEELQQEKEELKSQVQSLTDVLEKLTIDFDEIQTQHKATIRDLAKSHLSEIDQVKTALEKEVRHLKDRLDGEATANRELLGTAAEGEKRSLQLAGLLERSKEEEKALRGRVEVQEQQLATSEQTIEYIRNCTERMHADQSRAGLKDPRSVSLQADVIPTDAAPVQAVISADGPRSTHGRICVCQVSHR